MLIDINQQALSHRAIDDGGADDFRKRRKNVFQSSLPLLFAVHGSLLVLHWSQASATTGSQHHQLAALRAIRNIKFVSLDCLSRALGHYWACICTTSSSVSSPSNFSSAAPSIALAFGGTLSLGDAEHTRSSSQVASKSELCNFPYITIASG